MAVTLSSSVNVRLYINIMYHSKTSAVKRSIALHISADLCKNLNCPAGAAAITKPSSMHTNKEQKESTQNTDFFNLSIGC